MRRSSGTGQQGFVLVETAVVVAITGLALSGALTALGTSALGLRTASSENSAMSLAVAEVEYVKSQPFASGATSYPLGVSVPQGWSVTAAAAPMAGTNGTIQLITVTVSKGSKTMASLQDTKSNRQ